MNDPQQYQVVALRYRPQQFDALVGQSHITTALANAITQNRIGHAYLFTGARGVGKTSSARIFAKCLNCVQGPTTDPCNQCNICSAVSVGEDIDVLEIDGASNRGIDEIRQLRSNVAVRPSRARYKVYIIDEVHMLTSQAFNALLKTLEEPPAHVKFIFCTTDPQKIPITVLSRCQRFDFSPVKTNAIADRLREIAQTENVEAEDTALQLLARRANGSMRDSQSLLEQLLSFCGDKITIDEVHQLLGTTDNSRIAEIATAMTNKDSATTLNLIHDNISSGVNAGQLAAQLLGYFRDMLVTRVGCNEETLLNCTPDELQALAEQGEQLGLETILLIVQLLDRAVVTMQSSLHSRTLLEVAAVKICGLEHLESIAGLIKSLSAVGNNVTISSGAAGNLTQPSAASSSKKNEINNLQPQRLSPSANPATAQPTTTTAAVADQPATAPPADVSQSASQTPSAKLSQLAKSPPTLASPTPTSQAADLTPAASTPAASAPAVASSSTVAASPHDAAPCEATKIYQTAIQQLGEMTAGMAERFEKVELNQGKMVVTLLEAYNTKMCSNSDRKQKIESAVKSVAGRDIRVDFVTSAKPPAQKVAAKSKMTRVQQIRALQNHPFVKEAIDIFDCEITDFFQR